MGSGSFQLTLGARPLENGRTQFRVWAPRRRRVDVCVHEPGGLRCLPLEPSGRGYFEGSLPVPVGGLYKYRLDGGEAFPDPCSRLLHQKLLRLRREDPVFAAQDLKRIAGAVLSPHALVLRYFGSGQEGDRLVLLNLGAELEVAPCPEPRLAPPPGNKWSLVLASGRSATAEWEPRASRKKRARGSLDRHRSCSRVRRRRRDPWN